MNTHPTLNQEELADGWKESRQPSTTSKGLFDSGRTFTVTTRTFDAITFSHTIKNINDASKVLLEDFYKANKSTSFYWLNSDDLKYYDVQFDGPQRFEANNDINSWNVTRSLTQYTDTTICSGCYGYGIYGDGKYGGAGS